MKSLAALFLALPLALPLAAAVPASPSPRSFKRDAPNGVLGVSLRKIVAPRDTAIGTRRMAMMSRPAKAAQKASRGTGPPRQSLVDHNEYYLADLAIGTPPQPVSLLVDTGGWVTWVNPDCTRAARPADCTSLSLPGYNASLSNPPPVAVHDLDQVVVYGDYSMAVQVEGMADVFTFGSGNSTSGHVDQQPFGVAVETIGLSTGILALGPDGATGFNSAVSNFSVVSTLARQGVIASRVFSLAYGRGKAASAFSYEPVGPAQHVGSLVFGGVDRNQFRGPLGKTPILPRDATVDGWRYWLSVTQVRHNAPGPKAATATNANSTKGSAVHAAMPAGNASYMADSGTTGIYVPRDAYDAVLAETNLTRNPLRPEGFPDVDCTMANLTGSFSFTFAPPRSAAAAANSTAANSTTSTGITIDVPYSALIHPERNLQTNDTSKCFFALSSGGSAPDDGDIYPILGVEFFKAAYAVFDWDNQEVSLGQGASCGEPDLVAVGSGPNAVPRITGNCK
ncbi:hypothetical protein SCUCBS95973_002663 [Sporothrix curviconia]|uniref:Peptidase A1 domain-containing protein n=1 Tax=Sporothrix curviconia TaxID=1260050 RepID=A0ABP0B9S8_9PEZI